MSVLRIALLDHPEGAYSRQLETGLRAAGHEPRLVGASSVGFAEAVMRRRGFTPALSRVPGTVAELLRGEFDLAHAFSAPDAAAALLWRRVRGRPAVFTCTEPLDRAELADRRLRLHTLAQAIEGSDAFVAATKAVRASAERWFACSPVVIGPEETAEHARLYRELLARG